MSIIVIRQNRQGPRGVDVNANLPYPWAPIRVNQEPVTGVDFATDMTVVVYSFDDTANGGPKIESMWLFSKPNENLPGEWIVVYRYVSQD